MPLTVGPPTPSGQRFNQLMETMSKYFMQMNLGNNEHQQAMERIGAQREGYLGLENLRSENTIREKILQGQVDMTEEEQKRKNVKQRLLLEGVNKLLEEDEPRRLAGTIYLKQQHGEDTSEEEAQLKDLAQSSLYSSVSNLMQGKITPDAIRDLDHLSGQMVGIILNNAGQTSRYNTRVEKEIEPTLDLRREELEATKAKGTGAAGTPAKAQALTSKNQLATVRKLAAFDNKKWRSMGVMDPDVQRQNLRKMELKLTQGMETLDESEQEYLIKLESAGATSPEDIRANKGWKRLQGMVQPPDGTTIQETPLGINPTPPAKTTVRGEFGREVVPEPEEETEDLTLDNLAREIYRSAIQMGKVVDMNMAYQLAEKYLQQRTRPITQDARK